MKKYILSGIIATPLHIGSGNTLDPLEYVISDGTMHVIDQQRFIEHLSDKLKKEFMDLINQDKMLQLRSFVRQNFNPEGNYIIYSASVESHVEKEYKEKIGEKSLKNQLLVHTFIRSPYSNHAYIPGSSLKGAIRTALLDSLSKQKKPHLFQNQSRRDKKAQMLEAELLDNITFNRRNEPYVNIMRDPFRMVKISDIQLPPEAITVRHVYNVSPDRSSDIPMTYEVVKPDVRFNGEITLLTDEREQINKLARSNKHRINQEINIYDIMQSCDNFYRQAFQEEWKHFQNLERAQKYYRAIDKRISEKGDNEVLIRLGKFSQVEFITLPKYRNPKVPGKQQYKGYGKTRNLVDGKLPAGWVKLAFFEG